MRDSCEVAHALATGVDLDVTSSRARLPALPKGQPCKVHALIAPSPLVGAFATRWASRQGLWSLAESWSLRSYLLPLWQPPTSVTIGTPDWIQTLLSRSIRPPEGCGPAKRAAGSRCRSPRTPIFVSRETLDVHVHLDTDGNRTTDFKIWIFTKNVRKGGWCELRERFGEPVRGHLRLVEGSPDNLGDGRIACHVKLSLIKPSARIAWWLSATLYRSAFNGPGHWWHDRAPDSGWYV